MCQLTAFGFVTLRKAAQRHAAGGIEALRSFATTPTASLQTRGPHAVQDHYQLGQKLRHKIGKARRPPGDDDDLNPFILEISERFGRSRIDADSLQDSAEDLQRQVQMALLQANSPPRADHHRPLSRRIAF